MARNDRTAEILARLDVSAPTQTRPKRLEEPEPLPPAEAPITPMRRSASETKYWEPVLYWVQEHGFTHPSWGGWLQLPREFDAIVALEEKKVVQVILEIMRQTIGWIDPNGTVDEQGRPKRVEWAQIDTKHFVAICNGSSSQANEGIQEALKKKYIERERLSVALRHGYITRADLKRPLQGGGFVYRIRFNSSRTNP